MKSNITTAAFALALALAFGCSEKCGEAKYDPEKQFCSEDKVYEKCGGNEYNPAEKICIDGKVTAKCGDKGYDPAEQFCLNNEVVEKCGGKELDPVTQFCYNSEVVAKCGGNEYKPDSQFCYSGYGRVFDKCDGKEFNPETHICKSYKNIGKITHRCDEVPYDNETQGCCVISDGGANIYNLKTEFCGTEIFGGYGKVYAKCEGKKYDYAKQSCENDKLQDYKCGGKKYNFAKQFCDSDKLYDRCPREMDDNGQYDPKIEACCKYSYELYGSANEVRALYNLSTHTCQEGLGGWVRDNKEIIKVASNASFDDVIKLISEKEDSDLSSVFIMTSVNGEAYSETFTIFRKSSMQGDNQMNLIVNIISDARFGIYMQDQKPLLVDNYKISEMLTEIFNNSRSKRDKNSIVITAENSMEFSRVIPIVQKVKAIGFTTIKLARK